MEALTPQEIEASDRNLGEQFAADAIAFAHWKCKTSSSQASELRFWFGFLKSFPASSAYSLPILAAEINRLEEGK